MTRMMDASGSSDSPHTHSCTFLYVFSHSLLEIAFIYIHEHRKVWAHTSCTVASTDFGVTFFSRVLERIEFQEEMMLCQVLLLLVFPSSLSVPNIFLSRVSQVVLSHDLVLEMFKCLNDQRRDEGYSATRGRKGNKISCPLLILSPVMMM